MIFETLGTPTEEDWPGMTSLPDYIAFKPCPGISLSDIFIAADDATIKIMQDMFHYDPNKRIDCTQVYFYQSKNMSVLNLNVVYNIFDIEYFAFCLLASL